jgi:hypothetical protein
MVYSPKLSCGANGSNSIGIGLSPGETILFDSLEFTTERLGRLSLSPMEGDSGTIFIVMVHSGSPSLHTTVEDSSNKRVVALRTRGALDPPARECATW